MLIANYFSDFHCIGSDCEDNCCCVNWRITVDKDVYHRYKQNRHPALMELFREHVERTNVKGPLAAAEFGVIKLDEHHCCPFLDAEKLCLIQKTLGADWLSTVCTAYPRIVRKMNGTHEATLTVSCPEAARVILNRREPIAMLEQPDDQALIRYTRSDIRSGKGVAARAAEDIRAYCIAILQAREYPLDARMMLLGEFIAGIDHMVASGQDAAVPALLDNVRDYLSGAKDYRADFAAYRGSVPLKLQVLLHSILNLLGKDAPPRFKECLADFNEGLGIGVDSTDGRQIEEAFLAAYAARGKEVLVRNAHLFENYLVNLMLNGQFPFGDLAVMEKLFDSYIRLSLNYSMLKLLAVGMAGRPQGVSDVDLIKLFQSFSRRADHGLQAIKQLDQMVAAKGWNNLPSIAMTMLDE